MIPINSYLCKKWFLFSFALIELSLSIMAIIFVIVNLSEKGQATMTSMASLFITFIISSIIHLIGIVGAVKEHYCLVVSYSLICATIAVLGAVANFFSDGPIIIWYSVFLFCIICFIGQSYANDIRKLTALQTSLPLNIGTTPEGYPNQMYSGPEQSYQCEQPPPYQLYNQPYIGDQNSILFSQPIDSKK